SLGAAQVQDPSPGRQPGKQPLLHRSIRIDAPAVLRTLNRSMVRAHEDEGFSAYWSPSTSTSILVRRNVPAASSGVQQMGSFSLNDVFSSTGTPVARPNASIRS